MLASCIAFLSFLALLISGLYNLRKGRDNGNSDKVTIGIILLGFAVVTFIMLLIKIN